MLKRFFSVLIVTVMLCGMIILPETAWAVQNFNVYEGYKSAKITCLNTDTFIQRGYQIELEANTTYTLSAWSKGTGNPSIRLLTTNWSKTLKQMEPKSGSIWQETTTEYTTGADPESVILVLTNNPHGGNGTKYIDNISITKPGGPNLVKNPGFELGESDWKLKSTECIYLETSDDEVFTDNHVVELEANVIEQPNGNNNLNLYAGHRSLKYVASETPQTVSQTNNIRLTFKNDDLYNVSVWTRSPDNVSIDLNVKDSSGACLFDGGMPYTINSTSSWMRTTVPFTTSSSDKDITVEFITKPGQAGELFIDYCFVYSQKKPVGMNSGTLFKNSSFEDNTSWTGITDGFSFYERYNSTMGDVSGGVRIMPVGDSITAGMGGSSDTGGYKRGLYEKYKQDGTAVSFVGPNVLGETQGFPAGSGHAGNSGWTISQVQAQISSWISAYEPQVILLMIGTNDIKIKVDGQGNDLIAAAPDKINALIDQITSADPNIELYVSKITPLTGTDGTNINALNAEIESIVNQKSAINSKIHLADMSTVVKANTTDMVDYVHPNDTGYAKMAQQWFDTTKDLVKTITPSEFIPDAGTSYDGKTAIKYNPYYVPYYTLLSYEMLIRGTFPVDKNTNYIVSMMARGEQGVSCQVRIQGDWQGKDIIKSNTFVGGPKWQKYEFSFNSGDRASAIFTFVNNCMSTGNMYIDCITICKEGTTEPLLSNPSMERDAGGNTSWGNGNPIYSFVDSINISIKQGDIELKTLVPGKIDISANLVNVEPSGQLAVALYKGGILQKCAVSKEGTEIATSIDVDKVDSDTTLKIIILDSLDKMHELRKGPIILTKNQRTR